MSREAGAGGAEDTRWIPEDGVQHNAANGGEVGRRGGRRGGGNDQARWREARTGVYQLELQRTGGSISKFYSRTHLLLMSDSTPTFCHERA